MTEYNGQTITYDKIGNPLTYRDGMTMTWKRGRQLTALQTEENSIQYKYDSDSIRTSKIVNGVVHTYEYLNGLLMHETRGEQAYDYYYDANGQLYAVSYKLSETDTKKVYYFTHNWRGDIVGIYNGNGDLKATYEYDAWGNVVSIEDANGNAITSATHIANLNPFRYRGYYMDTETGLYYLMSRYYDPVTHRFVNADGYFQSGGDILDTNMNTYCGNNPINYVDYFGTRCHANDNGRSGPLCFTDFKTGYCSTCKKQECCLPTAVTVTVIEGVKLPYYGEPNSRVYDNEGNWRTYNEYGTPKYDYHSTDHGNSKNHPHGLSNPNGEHMHEWGFNEKNVYNPGPCLPWKGSEEKTLQKSQVSWDLAFNYDFSFDMPSFVPPTGEMPLWERVWHDITQGKFL